MVIEIQVRRLEEKVIIKRIMVLIVVMIMIVGMMEVQLFIGVIQLEGIGVIMIQYSNYIMVGNKSSDSDGSE